jgi:hypothetical protein
MTLYDEEVAMLNPEPEHMFASLFNENQQQSKSDVNAKVISPISRSLYPWDLTRVPNYDPMKTVAVEESDQIDEHTFQDNYVLKNKPCLVKGAAVQWPAFLKWCTPDYLLSKIGDFGIQASCTPKLEAFGIRPREQDLAVSEATRKLLLPAEPVRQLLPQLRNSNNDVLFIEFRPADGLFRCLGEDLVMDGARFSFLPKPSRPRRFSRSPLIGSEDPLLDSGWAVMIYKNSYSDWHFHPGTEAMMCQILGTKDVLLLPPTEASWEQIVPIHIANTKVYDVDTSKFPAYLDVQPYHVVVEPGDGLFIPINWWHAVQGRNREYGITVPITWNGSYYDPQQPASRHFFYLVPRTNIP